jgi:thymidylate kinase
MIVVQDRGTMSTAVYQAGEDADVAAWIRVEMLAHGIPQADVTLVLHLPDDERERRLAASPRGLRPELGTAEERARVARLYRHHAATYPGAVEVSAEGPLEEVVARCLAVLG